MKELYAEIDKLIHNTKGDLAVINAIKAEKTLFPFSTESKLLGYFLSIGELTYE